MQETFKTTLPPGFIMATDAPQLLLALNALFDSNQQPYQLMVSALTDEVRDKFGSPEITGINFEVKTFNCNQLQGRIRVNYDLRLTFSCSAIVNDHQNQHSYWNFIADHTAGTILFSGEEYGDVRSTADEF